MITKLTLRNLQANAGRFVLTTFGVVLAVSFVVSAFVLGDGLRKTFGDLTTDIVAGTDLQIDPVEQFGAPSFFDADDVAAVSGIDGVEQAAGFVEAPVNSVRPITPDGDEIPTNGPPQLAFSWTDAPGFSPLTLVEGDSPEPGEFLIDLGSADRHGFEVDESYTVITATGRHELTLSGLTRFGSENQTLGAVLMSMNVGETQQLFGTPGFDGIAVALTDAARADVDAAAANVGAVLPDADVLTQATVADQTASEFNTQISIIQNILLGFAGVALLVSIFIIGNTFAIVLQQRTREMGLLRLVGADAGQLRRGAMGEAAAIGVLASAIGIPGGIGVAAGITSLFESIGLTLPAYDTVVSLRTIAVAIGVGLGVTLAAAWWPTRAASRVPALAALRTGANGDAQPGQRRLVAGAVLGVVGIGIGVFSVLASLSSTATISLMVLGALAIFAAVTLLSPRLVAPVAAGFGALLARFGMPGVLATRNATRQATRTATTAAALMIGLAVVSMALVVGQSIKTQLGSTIEESVTAEYLLTDQASEAGFPTTVVDELTADPAIGAVTGFRYESMQLGDELIEAAGVDMATLGQLIDVDLTSGGIPEAEGGALIHDDSAVAAGLSVGDSFAATLADGSDAQFVVAGTFADDSLVDSQWLVGTETFTNTGLIGFDDWIAFSPTAGADAAAVESAIASIEQRYPQGELETASEFQERVEGLIDQILSVLNALVALAVVIALIGIANTLALSVSERTREIGLVRAVGMSTRGVRRMIRYESAIIATFGAVLGVTMGIGFGWLTVAALPASFAGAVSIPTGQILVLVAVAAVAGLVAAWLPARRAGRMNVLAAIAH